MGKERVPDPVHGQEHAIGEQPGAPEIERPEEIDPLEVAEKQWRIADWQEEPTAVADHEDEEDERVGDMPAFLVGFDQRPHQQHRGAGGADEARQRGANGEEGGIHRRRGHEIPLDAHAPGDGIESKQQDDEGDIFGEHGVGQHRCCGGPGGAAHRRGHCCMRGEVEVDRVGMEKDVVGEGHHPQPAGHQQFAGVVFPPMGGGGGEWKNGDRCQQQRKGEHRQRRGGRGHSAMAGRRSMVCRGGMVCRGMRRTGRHDAVPALLRPAEEGRPGVGGQEDRQPEDRLSRGCSGRRREGSRRGRGGARVGHGVSSGMWWPGEMVKHLLTPLKAQ